jgi:hypothetical protein
VLLLAERARDGAGGRRWRSPLDPEVVEEGEGAGRYERSVTAATGSILSVSWREPTVAGCAQGLVGIAGDLYLWQLLFLLFLFFIWDADAVYCWRKSKTLIKSTNGCWISQRY